jgi:hypothetical protein
MILRCIARALSREICGSSDSVEHFGYLSTVKKVAMLSVERKLVIIKRNLKQERREGEGSTSDLT